MTDRDRAVLAVQELARAWRAAHEALAKLPIEDRRAVVWAKIRDRASIPDPTPVIEALVAD